MKIGLFRKRNDDGRALSQKRVRSEILESISFVKLPYHHWDPSPLSRFIQDNALNSHKKQSYPIRKASETHSARSPAYVPRLLLHNLIPFLVVTHGIVDTSSSHSHHVIITIPRHHHTPTPNPPSNVWSLLKRILSCQKHTL